MRNDILEGPEAGLKTAPSPMWSAPRGAYLGTGFYFAEKQDPGPAHFPQCQRHLRYCVLAAPGGICVELPQTVLEPDDLSACRFIFGEADQFPGLTVDRFSNILVTQTLSVGMEKLKPVLFPILAEVLRADGQTIDGIYASGTTRLCVPKRASSRARAGSSPARREPPGLHPDRDLRERRFSTTSISRTARRPASSSIRSTTAGRWHALLQVTPCWTAFTHTGSFALNAAKGGAAR